MTRTQQLDGALHVEGIHVKFGGLNALTDVSITATPGKVLGVVGPNGAGKTTLFNVISGVVPTVSGTIILDSEELTGLPAHVRARAGLSRTFQNLALNDDMSVIENVLLGTHREVPVSGFTMLRDALTRKGAARERAARARAFAVLAELGLLYDANRDVSELPFGSRRRVDMARALCGDPKVVLFDEPFSGLGDRERPLMSQLIRDLRAKGDIGMILVEHDMAVVADLCDELVVLNEGHLIASGDPETVLANPTVQEAYLGPQLKRMRRGVSA